MCRRLPLQWRTPRNPPCNGDLFNDRHDTVLRNTVVTALVARDPQATAQGLEALAAEVPDDPMLSPAGVLLDVLRAQQHGHALTPAQAQAWHRRLRDEVAAAADAALSGLGAGRMQPAWQALARATAALTFDPDRVEAHAAPAWPEAGCGHQAAAAVAAIDSWRRVPPTLQWMIQAQTLAGVIDSVWPLLAELGLDDAAARGRVGARQHRPAVAPAVAALRGDHRRARGLVRCLAADREPCPAAGAAPGPGQRHARAAPLPRTAANPAQRPAAVATGAGPAPPPSTR